MNLYAVYNGWRANEPVHVLLEADSPEAAREEAERLLRVEDANKRNHRHGPTYWEKLRVERVILPQVSEGAPMGDEVTL